MDALIIASGAVSILREAMRSIEESVRNGTIPVDSQETLHRKIDSIRAGDFSGPEWLIDPPPPPS